MAMSSSAKRPAASSLMRGSENTIRYRAKGTIMKTILDEPDDTPRRKDGMSPCETLSESSVNIAVVMGTTRIA